MKHNNLSTYSGIRFAKANVNGVNGVILFPDNWDSSFFPLDSTDQHGVSFNSNIFNDSQWVVLESAGAVFLPVAGRRIEASVVYTTSNGYYWSASHSNDYDSFVLFINDLNLDYGYERKRSIGRSVRLVLPAK